MEPLQPYLMAAFNNNVLHDVTRKPALVVANFKLVRQLDNKKNEIRRLRKSLKHRDQQILALRKYIIDMKKENPTPNDGADNISVDFENMKVEEEAFDPDFRALEVVEEEVIHEY